MSIKADNIKNSSGWLMGIVSQFLSSKLSPIVIVAALLLGVLSIILTPKEEEPQIVVPLADIFVSAPGASAEELEQLVSTPLERLLWQIDGVEYVYSMSYQDYAVITVRFYVGEEREAALVRLHNKIMMNQDLAPSIVRGWLVKPVEIDDVPIVTLSLHSDIYDDYALRRMGEELLVRLSEVKNVSRSEITGGRRQEARVSLYPERMAAFSIDIGHLFNIISSSDVSLNAGRIDQANKSFVIGSNAFLKDINDLSSLVVGVHESRPVYLRDIAELSLGPEEAYSYSRYSTGAGEKGEKLSMRPSVTIAMAKKKGSNAVIVAKDIIKRMEALKKDFLPAGVDISISRNYGDTAQEKVNELLLSLAFAIASVVLLLALSLGWREAMVVVVAVPLSFSLALFVNYITGYTINRVTLFALILSLGLVVDDPITNVDNIQRNILKGEEDPKNATLTGVREVLSPVIMSTVAIILCFAPLFFITGMMGPYMAPMAINVPLTVSFSTLWALTVVPWLSWLLLRKRSAFAGKALPESEAENNQNSFVYAYYRKLIRPFLLSRSWRWGLLFFVVLLFIASLSLALFKKVPLKLLPFDNKSEFQLMLELPEGSPLEKTDVVVRSFENYLSGVPEVRELISFVGVASPMDFNGMVRHYYLREGPNLADIRVNLVDKSERSLQSHALVLRLRSDLEAMAEKAGARLQLVEVPPGPPVLSTLVAEIYGKEDTDYKSLLKAAKIVKGTMGEEPFVRDLDIMPKAGGPRISFEPDREKAALHGISVERILKSLETAVGGSTAANLHREGERFPLPIKLKLPREIRSSTSSLLSLCLQGSTGEMLPLAELVKVKRDNQDLPVYHKNLRPVVYVSGEMAGPSPAEAVLNIMARLKKVELPEDIEVRWAGEGEWKITLEVFRDMGLAFAAALTGIYLLLVIQSGSFGMPLLIMMAIPLTLLGILPGFWFLNLIAAPSVGIYSNPVFFTATSMIGMIALGGIVIRNSLVLVEFIQEALAKNMVLEEAVLQSGAIRLRPIVLTAMTTAIGAVPITFDPVFSGLAWALIFGLLASTLFTLIVVPVSYYALLLKKK